jgi:hypothetical protein
MKIYRCQACDQVVYFENTQCMACGAPLGFLPDHQLLTSLEATQEGGVWRALAPPAQGQLYRMCQNYDPEQVCNWMVPAPSTTPYCAACRFNRTIPDLNIAENRELWRRLEAGKRRLIYSLMRLRLPLLSKQENSESGLAFAFLADPDPLFVENAAAMTGHAQGLITINIAEADDATRERTRQQMAEPYRTLLGHFRHESGHYYWYVLARRADWVAEFRRVFGDERQDYALAMQHNYQQGPPPDWQDRFISAYAAAHPWEDWAETWAHCLHIIDVLETAWAFRLRVSPGTRHDQQMTSAPDFDPYRAASLEQLIDHWLPLTYAVNSLNRSMGQPDLYPFVLAPAVLSKLGFVYRGVRQLVAGA